MNKEPTEALPFPQVSLYLFNTETRKKQLFQPIVDKHVKMYTCGPTVYDYAHIGNFRTYIFEDILRRTLKLFGYQVTQVMNITDVDDKTIKGAVDAKVSLTEYTEPFKIAFFKDIQALRIEKAEFYPAATNYIPQMIDFIKKLIEKGVAYQSKDKSVYFSIDKFPRYGALSGLKIAELKVGAGEPQVATDEYDKERVGDFVLWKAYDPKRDGHVFWESPFGPGRPGWHLECSTMVMSILGETIDIHAGGVDNIFPHHENEIAQSESCCGKQLARYWVHSEHLLVNHKKMSKSLGNFYTLRDLIAKGYDAIEVRYMLLHTHYKTPLNFTFEGMEGARKSLQRINDFVRRLQELTDKNKEPSKVSRPALQNAIVRFCEALADDLNLSVALAALFDLMHDINILYDQQKLAAADAREILDALRMFDRVLGVMHFEQEGAIPAHLTELLQRREEARLAKNWQQSDALRNEIHAQGYVIEDTPHGARLKKR